MTMAAFTGVGKPIMIDYVPSSSYSAGDVIMIGNLPCVAHEANPPFTLSAVQGPTVIKDALAVEGGVYDINADAAYAVGTSIWWDTVKQQVTNVVGPNAFHFGWIVGGPSNRLDDGGPTGAATQAYVLHAPQNLNALAIGQAGAGLGANFRNLIHGGDFNVNPWQRGTTISSIAAGPTYTADRWFVAANAASAAQAIQSAYTTVAGFANAIKWGRPSGNTDVHAINLGQVLETLNCVRTQGQKVTLSFYAKNGANYSGGALTIVVNHSVTAGNDTATHLVAASTNWQAVPTIVNTTQALTTTMTRYQFTGTVPATATQLGVMFTWTPVGTAGADDNVYIDGVQLEIGSGATTFEHRDAAIELELCQRYFFQANEGAANVVLGMGQATSTTVATIAIPLPVQMRAAPTAAATKGTIGVTTAAGANQALTTLAAGAAASTVNQMNLTATASAANLVAGNATLLIGNAGAGLISASADL